MKVILWAVRIILSALFLLASLGKVTGNPAIFDMFQDWGYSDWFCTFIGFFELIGAILLLIPKTTYYASIGLIILMIGALITHLIHDPIGQIIRPLVFLVFLGIHLFLIMKMKNLNL